MYVSHEPAKQSPFRSTTALLWGLDKVHCSPVSLGSNLYNVLVHVYELSTRDTEIHISNSGELGCDAFQTFCHSLRGDDEPFENGVIPSRSIFMSPSMSTVIGCAKVDAGTES